MKMLKNFSRGLMIIVTVLLMSLAVYASPSNSSDEATTALEQFTETFSLSESHTLASVSNDNIEEIHIFGEFTFSQFFAKFSYSTFSEERTISGEGKQGIEIGVLLYSVDKGQVVSRGKPVVRSIGASGLYSYTIPFEEIGENSVIIAVKEKDTIIIKRFVINRKDPNSKTQIENVNSKLYTDGSVLNTEIKKDVNDTVVNLLQVK